MHQWLIPGLVSCFQRLHHWREAFVCLFILLLALLAGCEGKKPEQTVKVAAQGVLSAALSRNGEKLVIGSVQHGGSLWDLSSKERLYNWNHKMGSYTSLRAVGASGNGQVAATVKDADIGVWDVSNGKSLNFWRAPDKVMSMTLGEQGRYALLGLQNSQVVYFDIQLGRSVYEFQHDAEIFGVSLSADGNFAMTGSDDRTARIWRLSDGELIQRFDHNNQVKTVALSPDGQLAFSSAQREDAVIWEVDSGAAKTKLDFRYENFTSARFSKDGRQLLLGTFRGDVYLVNTANGQRLQHWTAKARQLWGPASSGAVIALAFAESGKYIAVTSDGLIQQFGT